MLVEDKRRTFNTASRRLISHCASELAAEAAEVALNFEPLSECSVRLLINAEAQQGNYALALNAYERHEKTLKEDTGLRRQKASKSS